MHLIDLTSLERLKEVTKSKIPRIVKILNLLVQRCQSSSLCENILYRNPPHLKVTSEACNIPETLPYVYSSQDATKKNNLHQSRIRKRLALPFCSKDVYLSVSYSPDASLNDSKWI